MLIIDEARGCFYQKCFDPDCRAARARSNEIPLPAPLICSLSRPAPAGPGQLWSWPDPHLQEASARAECGAHRSEASAECEMEDEWSDEVLAGIDEILRQRGMAVEDGEEFSDDVLASIDDFLQGRELQNPVEQEAAASCDVQDAMDCEEWDDELLDGIDDMLRRRHSAELEAGEEGACVSGSPESGSCMAAPGSASIAATTAPAPAAILSDDESFDDACIRALEEVERGVVACLSKTQCVPARCEGEDTRREQTSGGVASGRLGCLDKW